MSASLSTSYASFLFPSPRVCPAHQRAESFTLPGVEGQLRFCQKCCKPQLVAEFTGPNRCCASKLAAYNARRRDATAAAQRERAAHGEAGAAGAASSQDVGLFRGNSVPSSTPSLEGSFSLAAGGDESPGGSTRAVAEAEAVELEPVPRMQPPTSVSGVASLKLSHATPVTLPPGLAAALAAARMFLPTSSPLALSGTPMPGCTLLVLDAFGDSDAVDETDSAVTELSSAPAVSLSRLLEGASPAAAFLRAQPSLRVEDGRGGVAAAALGQVSEGGSSAAVNRLPPPSSLAVLLPASQHRDAHVQPTLRLIGGSPLPAGLRCRLHGQWVLLSRSLDGVAFSLPPLPPGTEGVALFDIGGSGVSLAPPRPLLLLRCPDAVSEVEHTAASLLACERDAASSASSGATTAAAARRRAVEDALIAIGLALQPSASPALVVAAAQHALFMRWPACVSRALCDLAAACDEEDDTGDDAAHPASLSRLLSGTHGASFLHAAAASGSALLVAAVMEAGGESALFGSPGDAGSSVDGRTPLHLAACHADGAAIAAMASRDAAVPLDWTTVRDNRGRTPSSVACALQSRLVTSASLAALDSRMRFIDTSARGAVAAVCDELRSEGWLVPSLRCAEAASRLPQRLPRNVLETAAALTRRMLADAEAAEESQLADDEDDDATSRPQADADDIDDDIDAVAVPRDSLAVRLGFTEAYAAFSLDAFERSVPTIVAERLFSACAVSVAWHRTRADGRSAAMSCLARVASLGDAAAAAGAGCSRAALVAEARYSLYSNVPAWGVASLAAATILFAIWPHVSEKWEGAHASSASLAAGSSTAHRSECVRRLRRRRVRAALAGPVVALSWAHTYICTVALAETRAKNMLSSMVGGAALAKLSGGSLLAYHPPGRVLLRYSLSTVLPIRAPHFAALQLLQSVYVLASWGLAGRCVPLRLLPPRPLPSVETRQPDTQPG